MHGWHLGNQSSHKYNRFNWKCDPAPQKKPGYNKCLQLLLVKICFQKHQPLGMEIFSILSLHLLAFLMPVFYKLNHVWITEIPSVSGTSDSAGIGEKSTMFKAVLSRLKCSAARNQAFQKASLKDLIQVGSTHWSTNVYVYTCTADTVKCSGIFIANYLCRKGWCWGE